MNTIPVLLFVCMANLMVEAQPYIDPVNIRYTRAFRSGNKSATPFSHTYIGSDLPFQMKKNRFIVLSPFYENWNIDSGDQKKFLSPVSSIAMALSAITPLRGDHWSLTTTIIPRFNSEALKAGNSFQIGAVLLAVYKRRENLKYKLGMYINNEFFGLFIMPLAGIDWKINDRNNLFGVLPGRLTYEYKLCSNLYTGATFRAITNSYRLINGKYLRIDDNQLCAYLDFYATKHLVLMAEAGFGISRKLRSGMARNKNYETDFNWGNGYFIKICSTYRIRL